jgi:hypothetical protein
MWALRRMMAALLVAALVLAGPLGGPRSCSECPSDCPMHVKETGHGPAKGQPGCHRTPQPVPPGAVCLRADCGHDLKTESVLLLSLLPEPVRVSSPVPGPRIAMPAVAFASVDAPQPPHEPPRPVVG